MCGKKGEGRTSSIANGVCMDNYICKAGSPGSAKM